MSRTAKEVFANLTDYELIEVYYLSQAEVSSAGVGFGQLLFAFFLVAYFTGKQLSRTQAILVSILYSIGIWFTAAGMFINYSFSIETLSFLYQTEASLEISYMVIAAVILITAWVLSLVYMYQSRKEKGA